VKAPLGQAHNSHKTMLKMLGRDKNTIAYFHRMTKEKVLKGRYLGKEYNHNIVFQ
jgi:hypothetical protein